MNSDRIKHLEFIQNIITRMNTNSFQIKRMTVTIVAALLAVYVSTSSVLFLYIPIIPTLLFWFLDSYYLQQERKFRGVYNDVAGLKKIIEVKPYEMPIHKYTKKIDNQFSFWNVFISKTIFWLYFSIIFIIIFTIIAIGVIKYIEYYCQ